MLPYSREILFAVFQSYQSSWAWLIALFYAGLLAGWWLLQGVVVASWRRALSVWVLALAWAATGVLFFGMAFAPYDFIASWEAMAFCVQAGLMLWAGWLALRPVPVPPGPGRLRLSNLVLLVGLLGLPLWDWGAQLSGGQDWRSALAAARWFGTAPGPTVVVTFALLLRLGTPWIFWVVPLLWSFKAGLVAHWLNVTADFAVPLTGVVTAAWALVDRCFPAAPHR